MKFRYSSNNQLGLLVEDYLEFEVFGPDKAFNLDKQEHQIEQTNFSLDSDFNSDMSFIIVRLGNLQEDLYSSKVLSPNTKVASSNLVLGSSREFTLDTRVGKLVELANHSERLGLSVQLCDPIRSLMFISKYDLSSYFSRLVRFRLYLVC